MHVCKIPPPFRPPPQKQVRRMALKYRLQAAVFSGQLKQLFVELYAGMEGTGVGVGGRVWVWGLILACRWAVGRLLQ